MTRTEILNRIEWNALLAQRKRTQVCLLAAFESHEATKVDPRPYINEQIAACKSYILDELRILDEEAAALQKQLEQQ